MAKNLTLSVLKKLDSQFNTTKEIILSNNYSIQIDTHFRNSRIEEVFNKLIEIHKIIQDDDSLKDDFNFEKYSLLLLILNFTSLRNMELKNISEEIQVMNMLIDQNLFKEIIEKIEKEVPEELKKFNTKIFEIMGEKLEQLKAQQEFMNILSDEMEKGKIEQDSNIEEIEQKNEDNIAIDNSEIGE